ncbi:hypothetical protein A3L12_04395 [Thermococcus sp. P6]|uniref:hypothetical protein n=1 Tax=Thermococcus sp. P6 TaxID=122420 RepID=UPI000B59FD46|nr:hypothetical protein [Thermococcus sp. P6]ASJ10588.1 hypothetical protein A3L12_04395 [Thermococcus sp. P6]
MTTREEIKTLIERGQYEEAMSRIGTLGDPLEQVQSLMDLAIAVYERKGPLDWIPDIVEDALYISKKLKEHGERAVAYSTIASTLALTGYEDDAMDLFDRAIKESMGIDDPLRKGSILSEIAYRLAIAGYSEDALEVFDVAFNTIMGAEVDYNLKVDGIVEMGRLLEKAGDALPAEEALKFYRTAFDIFDKLHVNQRAAIVEKKIDLSRTVRDVGLPSIRRALLEGRFRYALALIEINYSGARKLIGKLQVALWMKKVNSGGYDDLVEKAFEESGDLSFTEVSAGKIASLLTELGDLRRALKFAMTIKDVQKRSEALGAIAIELARRKELYEAKEIAGMIPDPGVREEVLMEISTEEGR